MFNTLGFNSFSLLSYIRMISTAKLHILPSIASGMLSKSEYDLDDLSLDFWNKIMVCWFYKLWVAIEHVYHWIKKAEFNPKIYFHQLSGANGRIRCLWPFQYKPCRNDSPWNLTVDFVILKLQLIFKNFLLFGRHGDHSTIIKTGCIWEQANYLISNLEHFLFHCRIIVVAYHQQLEWFCRVF